MILKPDFDCIILGAGISGLTLARRLSHKGRRVLVVEKSRGVGGRMATRRDENATYDHGAQFYKIPLNSTPTLDNPWSESELAVTWFHDQTAIYKAVPGGLTRLAKQLAKNLNIVFEQKAVSVQQGPVLTVVCESGQQYTSNELFLSAPLPQSLELLSKSQIAYPKELAQIHYASALVGLFEVQSESAQIQKINYLQDISPEIYSISNQLSKKVSTSLAFTVVMQPDWSREHFEKNESDTIKRVEEIFSRYLRFQDSSFLIRKQQLKKWRFSHPLATHTSAHVVVGENKNIFLLGDAFGGPSIAGALRSAHSILL